MIIIGPLELKYSKLYKCKVKFYEVALTITVVTVKRENNILQLFEHIKMFSSKGGYDFLQMLHFGLELR